jgi:hypothetical protein
MMMKLVNKILRFVQLVGSVALIAGYFLNDIVWNLVLDLDLGISYANFVDIYLLSIAIVVGLVPIRYIFEKLVESKFLL